MPISLTFFKSCNLITLGGTPQSMVPFVPYLELIGSSSTCRWLRCVIFIVTRTSLGTWVIGRSRAITLRYAWSFTNPANRDGKSNAFLHGCPSILFFCSILNRPHDGHRYSDEPFRALDESKTVCEEAKKQTFREIERQTPDCAGAKLVIASTALRAYRSGHRQALVRCCEAWEPVG